MKIGILGGTFDPIHLGHLVLAEQVMDRLNLAKVIFVPSFVSPHKESSNSLAPEHRFKMVELATSGNEKFEVASIEIDRGDKSYTVFTLKEFKKIYPDDDLFFIAGSDVLYEKWKDFDEILKLVQFVVAKRSNACIKKDIDDRIEIVDIDYIDISSSRIRQMIKSGKSIRYLLPENVIQYIKNKSLYITK